MLAARVVYAPARLPRSPARSPRLVDLRARPTRKYQEYSSIFEHIRGNFKECSEYMSSTPGSRPV
jgi:hypothetical protein